MRLALGLRAVLTANSWRPGCPDSNIRGDIGHVAKVPIAEIADASRSEKICSSSNCGLDFA